MKQSIDYTVNDNVLIDLHASHDDEDYWANSSGLMEAISSITRIAQSFGKFELVIKRAEDEDEDDEVLLCNKCGDSIHPFVPCDEAASMRGDGGNERIRQCISGAERSSQSNKRWRFYLER